jgi:peptide/nickel transport system permease protein
VVAVSRLRFLARRSAFAVLSAWIVLTVVFLLVAVPDNPQVAAVKYAAAMAGNDPQKAAAAYRAAHNLDKSLFWRYRHWMVNVATLQWGRSQSMGRPVVDVLFSRVPYTLLYVVPGVLASVAAGVGLGVLSAFERGTWVDRANTASAYLGYAVPNFYIGSVFLVLVATPVGWKMSGYDLEVPLLATENLIRALAPAAVLATTLTASQLRYTRSLSMDFLGEDFVKLVRAKGAPPTRVARHVLRNAAVPLLTLVFADLVGVLVLNVYVLEFVFDVPGLGDVSLAAIRDRDVPLVLGSAFVLVLVGVLGNYFQDVAYTVLDPRVDEE